MRLISAYLHTYTCISIYKHMYTYILPSYYHLQVQMQMYIRECSSIYYILILDTKLYARLTHPERVLFLHFSDGRAEGVRYLLV